MPKAGEHNNNAPDRRIAGSVEAAGQVQHSDVHEASGALSLIVLWE